jgi:hypothetical protein
MKKIIIRLFRLGLIVFGVILLGIGISGFVGGVASRTWLRTDGIITAASVYSPPNSLDPPSVSYGTKISYNYKVAGVTYTGTRVCFGDYMTTTSPTRAFAVVRHYQPGTKVSVFYSPKNPKRAVLERGVFGGVWMAFGVGTVTFAAGLFLITKQRWFLASVNEQ